MTARRVIVAPRPRRARAVKRPARSQSLERGLDVLERIAAEAGEPPPDVPDALPPASRT